MIALIRQDLRLTLRQGADSLAALLFFVIVGMLFAFGLGPDPKILARIAPGVVWVTALLAALLPLNRQFGPDFEDGTLDLMMLSGQTAYELAAAKMVVHWLSTGLPLLVIAAPLALMLRLPMNALPPLLFSLLPGTLIFSLLGTFAASLLVGARQSGLLMPLLTLPLMIPALIFGSAAATSAHPQATFYMLGALLLITLPLAPLGTGLALRAACE